MTGQWQFDIAAPPSFDMEELARLRANALVKCSGPDFHYTLIKLIPLLVTKNCYSVFLLAVSMLEFSKHVITQVEALQPGQLYAQESSIEIKQPFSVADVLDLLEEKRQSCEVKVPHGNGMVSAGYAYSVLGDLIEDIRTKAGFPSPDLITSAEN